MVILDADVVQRGNLREVTAYSTSAPHFHWDPPLMTRSPSRISVANGLTGTRRFGLDVDLVFCIPFIVIWHGASSGRKSSRYSLANLGFILCAGKGDSRRARLTPTPSSRKWDSVPPFAGFGRAKAHGYKSGVEIVENSASVDLNPPPSIDRLHVGECNRSELCSHLVPRSSATGISISPMTGPA